MGGPADVREGVVTGAEWLSRVRRRRWYGEGPLHLVLMLASFALAGYAGLRLLGGGPWPLVVAWFAGAALLHDLVLLPLYSLADRVVCAVTAGTGRHRAWTGHVRVPAALSALLLLVWFPLIAGGGGGTTSYTLATGLPGGVFLSRWLLVTAVLFAASALLLLGRWAAPRLRGSAVRVRASVVRVRRRRATKRRSAPGR
ncbi:hypothetical protein [Streptomyces sp. NPDC048638]|uniref:hypothetical protein n=1 Tax=Streptomyces sp. NPDC048638 TaxID=3365580 RepID=UPI003710DCD5